MMAQAVPHQTTDKKRVKVYELRNNDWFDRGTGFCAAAFIPVEEGQPKEPRVFVESEEHPDRLILETKISKEDGFHKQGETLIVWTEPPESADVPGLDMALSFQEAEGCQLIWKFVDGVQQTFRLAEDGVMDDLNMDAISTIQLPPAELGHLVDIENNVRQLTMNINGRDALAKAIMTEDYIKKLIPLVEMAEDIESIQDLHILCNIMKTILLLNDTAIIEHAVSDECVMGVVGALEYDPDFPNHKANHRQWLEGQGRYKEVVRIEDEVVRRKIHQTYRLQYLKDVVLARILDDPTFSVLNSLIFFNQVDIVTHLQQNSSFLGELFGIFADPKEEQLRKKEAVLFIQQCCAIAKSIHPSNRQVLYNNFLSHGLLQVINFGLRNVDATVRVGATDILVSMIDHDPQMIRHTIYRQLQEKQQPLTDTLIDLLLIEADLGTKSQIADALKVLLDPSPPGGPQDPRAEYVVGQQRVRPQPTIDPQQELFLNQFYEHSAARLFKPLLDLEKKTDIAFDVMNDSIFTYLNDILCFYIRSHQTRSKYFVLQNNLANRFIQLLSSDEKHLQLVALRFFRQLVMLQDEFYVKHMTEKQVLGPVLDLLLRTTPRDNLIASACLDLFGLITKDEGGKDKVIKDLIKHLVDNYREKVQALSSMDTFSNILARYEHYAGFNGNVDHYFVESEDEAGRRQPNANRAMMEHLTIDQAQEDYWNCSDEEDENHPPSSGSIFSTSKMLVEYNSDEEADEGGDTIMASNDTDKASDTGKENEASASPFGTNQPPPEKLSEKRRREQEDEDEMDRLMQHKRRNSSSSGLNRKGLAAVLAKHHSKTSDGVREPRSRSMFAITISPNIKSAGRRSPNGENGS